MCMLNMSILLPTITAIAHFGNKKIPNESGFFWDESARR